MKDVVTAYWLNYKMATIDLGDRPKEEAEEHVLKSKFAIVTIHDVSPEYQDRIINFANELENLKIPYNFAVIPYHNQEEKNDIRKNADLIRAVKSYNQPIALHGLYHEHNGDIEEFRDLNLQETQNEIRQAVEIFSEAGIGKKAEVFVPPTWTINKQTMHVLIELGFSIVETEDEIIILNKNTRLQANILNWDQGSKELNHILLDTNKRSYRNKVMCNTQMVRIAIHPKDHENALRDQKEMIQGLKDVNYTFLRYEDVERLFG
jgi:predicted deacetylase